jgi:hypothetical protein
MKNYKNRNYLMFGLVTIVLFAVLLLSSCDKSEDIPVIPLPPGCDISNVTFATVQTLINSDCVGCHNSSNQHGGVNLEGYDNIKSVAQSGKLVTSLKGSMSAYFSGSDCDYFKISEWTKSYPK